METISRFSLEIRTHPPLSAYMLQVMLTTVLTPVHMTLTCSVEVPSFPSNRDYFRDTNMFQVWDIKYKHLVLELCMPYKLKSHQFSSVQSLSHVQLFATRWMAAPQASLSINTRSLPKLMPIESVMPSSHLILSSSSPPAPNPSQHQSLFQWVNSSPEVAKVLEFQL